MLPPEQLYPIMKLSRPSRQCFTRNLEIATPDWVETSRVLLYGDSAEMKFEG